MIALFIIGIAITVISIVSKYKAIQKSKIPPVKARISDVKNIEQRDKNNYLINEYAVITVEYDNNGQFGIGSFNEEKGKYKTGQNIEISVEKNGRVVPYYVYSKGNIAGYNFLLGFGLLLAAIPIIGLIIEALKWEDAMISIFGFVVGVLFTVIGFSLLKGVIKRKSEFKSGLYQPIQAKIIDIEKDERTDSDGDTYYVYIPTYQFEFNGETLKWTGGSINPKKQPIGYIDTIYRHRKTGKINTKANIKSGIFPAVICMALGLMAALGTLVPAVMSLF